MTSLRDQILNPPTVPVRSVKLHGYPEFFVRQISLGAALRSAAENARIVTDNKVGQDASAVLISICDTICDADGARLFKDSDHEELLKLPAELYTAMAEAASGVMKEVTKDNAGNS